MKKAEIVTGLVMLVACAVAVFAMRDLPYWIEFTPGPAFAPLWVAGGGAVLSLLLILAARRRDEDEPTDWPDKVGALRVWMTVAALCAVVPLAPWLGFVPASVLFALFVIVAVQRRRWWPSLVATTVITATVVGVFQVWLRVALPKGFLGI